MYESEEFNLQELKENCLRIFLVNNQESHPLPNRMEIYIQNEFRKRLNKDADKSNSISLKLQNSEINLKRFKKSMNSKN